MAKNNTPQDPYVRQQAAIRKAKGNPNKNVHHKKNNSNYGGGDYQKAKAAQAAKKPERAKLPLWLKITLGVLFGVLMAALILRMTVYKDNLFMNYLTSLLLGLALRVLLCLPQRFDLSIRRTPVAVDPLSGAFQLERS